LIGLFRKIISIEETQNAPLHNWCFVYSHESGIMENSGEKYAVHSEVYEGVGAVEPSIRFDMPDGSIVEIRDVVLDFNGTIAKDGFVLPDVAERLRRLSERGVKVHVVTADTNGTVRAQCKELPVNVYVCEGADVGKRKEDLVRKIGSPWTAAIGNGNNDTAMFRESELSISVIGDEGCFTKSLLVSDIVVKDILDALDLLLHENRLKATLRS
jgi:soluble P-type ATPase